MPYTHRAPSIVCGVALHLSAAFNGLSGSADLRAAYGRARLRARSDLVASNPSPPAYRIGSTVRAGQALPISPASRRLRISPPYTTRRTPCGSPMAVGGPGTSWS